MKILLKNNLYIIGFTLIISFAVYFNWQTPPNLDEARAYIISRYLSPFEIFTISKTEGHPFLWFYILMPIAKLHLFYPIPLYVINLTFILIALYFFYKNKIFPLYLKYFVTLSLPFLKLYNSFARCYSLTIMLSFIILSFYKQRFSKPFIYLTLIILLANSSSTGFFIASSLGLLFLYENIFQKQYTKQSTTIRLTFVFGAIELLLIFLQFYGYNTQIPIVTPKFNTLKNNINLAYSPINIYILLMLYLATFLIFIKNHQYKPLFFLFFSSLQLTILITLIHHGNHHHYYFYYINLISAYWMTQNLKHLYFAPLSILSFALIFNTNMHYKVNDIDYLLDLKNSAIKINQLYPSDNQEIFIFEDYHSNIIEPYLNPNITILNQTGTPLKTLKGLNEFLYFLYKKINPQDIINTVQKNPHVLLYKTCGKNMYNHYFEFKLKHYLNRQYCLYDIKLK